MSEVKKVSKKALNACIRNWFISSVVAGNYENQMGVGFAQSMVPVTKELYKNDPEGRKAAMLRGLEFFNTEPEVGCVIHGLSVAMEEQVAAGQLEPETITGMKTALMGPLAGIGDSIVQGVIIPILLALCIDLTTGGLVLGPVIYAIVLYAILIAITSFTFNFGYTKGSDAIMHFIGDGTINKIMTAAGIMGCTVMGALISKYVKFDCGLVFNIGGSAFNIQESLFNVIMPNILPLLFTIWCVTYLNKGNKSTKLILLIIAACIVVGLISWITGGAVTILSPRAPW